MNPKSLGKMSWKKRKKGRKAKKRLVKSMKPMMALISMN